MLHQVVSLFFWSVLEPDCPLVIKWTLDTLSLIKALSKKCPNQPDLIFYINSRFHFSEWYSYTHCQSKWAQIGLPLVNIFTVNFIVTFHSHIQIGHLSYINFELTYELFVHCQTHFWSNSKWENILTSKINLPFINIEADRIAVWLTPTSCSSPS